MLSKKKMAIAIVGLGLLFTGISYAHTPLCSCFDNADGTITCEGGFSDGSSASGVEIRVEDKAGKILIKGKMDEDSEYTFDKPATAYKVVFNAGEGHRIQIDGEEILE